MDSRRRTSERARTGSARRSTARRSSSKNKKTGMTPGIAAVIAAAAVVVICVPLVIMALNKTAEVSEDKVLTAQELGISVVTPPPEMLEIEEQTLPDDDNTPSASGTWLYEKGASSPDVIEIQKRLMSLGYMAENEPTELFGPATSEAVKLFQTKHGLSNTGNIDQKTHDVLFSDSAVFYTASVGMSGSDIATIQSLLKKLDYFSGAATGYFGTETEAAVKNFQKNNGLTVDGKVGINTLNILKSSKAVKYTAPTPSPAQTASAEPQAQ